MDGTSLDELLLSADVICTTTNTSTPILRKHQVKSGAHINAIGSYLPTMQELSFDLVAHARVVIDTVEAWHAGDLAIPLKQGMLNESARTSILELGAFVHRERYAKPYRTDKGIEAGFELRLNEQQRLKPLPQLRESPDDITIFKSVGTAVQDVTSAFATLQVARQMGLAKSAQW